MNSHAVNDYMKWKREKISKYNLKPEYRFKFSDAPGTKAVYSGIFVQRVSGAQLHFIINTPHEVELSSTSIFLFPE